jgi:PAS domain S-box-containing protein
MALMLDSIKDYAMVLLDDDGRVAVWHHGAQALFGYDEPEIGDREATALYAMSGTEFRAWLTEARVRGYAQREGTCRRRDQTSFIGSTTIRPLVAEPGVPPGFVAVTHDVTDRRSLEERLRQSQKMEAVGNLAGGVAHDFNNLLSAISGYAEWLEQDLATESRQEMITGIQQAADRGAELIRQLLTFSRRQTIQPALVNLSSTVEELLPLLRRLVGATVQIIDGTSPTLAAVLGDRGEIERVLMNVVVNAKDAMPRGGHITIRTADTWVDDPPDDEMQPGPYVVLEVEDTGSGMDAETLRRAFEPFFTTKPVGKGSGLGLSTVYGIVRQMGGAIAIESTPGRGATVRILLPRSSGVSRAAASVPA